jgi:putative N6-adenine-specific DNA methylase
MPASGSPVPLRCFATAAKGTEPALRDELRELRIRGVRADRGGVHFEGGIGDAALVCLWSRIAVRVLLEVGRFDAPDATALYEGLRAIDFTAWMSPKTTLAVRATCRSSRMTHSQFVAQKTKDAIVDGLRDRYGTRPDVDRDDPDVGIAVHLARDEATIYLDVSGGSLHERGWRSRGGEAPLRETLAAAILRLSGWDRESALVDPMCGAGTLAIEAAAWSRAMAPGLTRKRFGFERWASHDEEQRSAMRELRSQAKARARKDGPEIRASDVDPHSVDRARRNARAAGVDIVVERRDVRDLEPPGPGGLVVTNPPYGERLDRDEALYTGMAESFRRVRRATVAILAGTPAIARAMRREPDRWWIVYNGPIECRLLVYAMP